MLLVEMQVLDPPDAVFIGMAGKHSSSISSILLSKLMGESALMESPSDDKL